MWRAAYRPEFTDTPLPWCLTLHGITQTAWFLLLPVQSGLIVSRRHAWHRTLGWCGAGIARLVVAKSPLVMIRAVPRQLASGTRDVIEAFLLITNALRVPFFVVMVCVAIWQRKRMKRARARSCWRV